MENTYNGTLSATEAKRIFGVPGLHVKPIIAPRFLCHITGCRKDATDTCVAGDASITTCKRHSDMIIREAERNRQRVIVTEILDVPHLRQPK